jgi:hypothetical protein
MAIKRKGRLVFHARLPFRPWLEKQIGVKARAGRENLYELEGEFKSWVGEKTPLKMGDIVTAVSEIYQRSAGRWLWQEERFELQIQTNAYFYIVLESTTPFMPPFLLIYKKALYFSEKII